MLDNIFFSLDYKALGLACGILILTWLVKSIFFPSTAPYFNFSNLTHLSPHQFIGRAKYAHLPQYLYQASLIFFLLAFLDPHLMLPKNKNATRNPNDSMPQELPTKGIAIYLALDQSGSMAEKVETRDKNGRRVSISKMDLLKQVTEQFILNRPSDLIGLIAFARIPKVLAPLTLDHALVLDQLHQLKVVQNPDEDGTGIGYAIFKTANLIAATRHFAQDLLQKGLPAYQIKSGVIVVVTDGLQDPSYLDLGNRLRTIELTEAAAYLKSEGIHVYIINIDPSFAAEQYAPHRRQMKEITEMTGGEFYMVDQRQNLQQIYATINQLEKGEISPSEGGKLIKNPLEAYKRFSFFPFLITLGLACLLQALILETTWLRKVP